MDSATLHKLFEIIIQLLSYIAIILTIDLIVHRSQLRTKKPKSGRKP
jgi:hypothetical protein